MRKATTSIKPALKEALSKAEKDANKEQPPKGKVVTNSQRTDWVRVNRDLTAFRRYLQVLAQKRTGYAIDLDAGVVPFVMAVSFKSGVSFTVQCSRDRFIVTLVSINPSSKIQETKGGKKDTSEYVEDNASDNFAMSAVNMIPPFAQSLHILGPQTKYGQVKCLTDTMLIAYHDAAEGKWGAHKLAAASFFSRAPEWAPGRFLYTGDGGRETISTAPNPAMVNAFTMIINIMSEVVIRGEAKDGRRIVKS